MQIARPVSRPLWLEKVCGYLTKVCGFGTGEVCVSGALTSTVRPFCRKGRERRAATERHSRESGNPGALS